MSHNTDVSIVDVSLITICVESLLYGIVCVLFMISTHLHIERQWSSLHLSTPQVVAKPPIRVFLRAIFKPIFVGTVIIYIFATAHWITNVYRLFEAFKLFNGGKTPAAVYLNLSQATHVAKSVFVLGTGVTGDAMLIYRLYIIWNFNRRVVIIPMLTFIGLAVCGIGLIYQFSQFQPGTDIFNSATGRWITIDIVFTICTNIYCTIMIAFRMWSISVSAQKFGGRSLTSISAVIVESAAIYTAWGIAFLVVYEARSTVQFFTVDNMAQISAIATLLINVRVGLGWGGNQCDPAASSLLAKYQEELIHHCDSDSVSTANGHELETPRGHWPRREGVHKV